MTSPNSLALFEAGFSSSITNNHRQPFALLAALLLCTRLFFAPAASPATDTTRHDQTRPAPVTDRIAPVSLSPTLRSYTTHPTPHTCFAFLDLVQRPFFSSRLFSYTPSCVLLLNCKTAKLQRDTQTRRRCVLRAAARFPTLSTVHALHTTGAPPSTFSLPCFLPPPFFVLVTILDGI